MDTCKVGSWVWILLYTGGEEPLPVYGRVTNFTASDDRSTGSIDIITVSGDQFHSTLTRVFDHKPTKVIVEDCYGSVTIWQ